MAEPGFLGGILGGEDEAPEVEASNARISAEAYAAALAEEQARRDPEVARAAAEFLRDQSTLLRAQTAELEEQRRLKLHHLQGQTQEQNLRRFAQRVRNATQVFTALVLTVLGVGLGVMIYDAVTSRSVVVEPFDAPPTLASQGVSGKVVATDVLDALQRLSTATRSGAKGLNSKNAWSSDVKIEVPETGVSIGEIDRLLHERFGHDLHIEGDLIQTTDNNLALTVRGDGVPPKTFTAPTNALDSLTTQAAEYVYGRSQPYQFVTYLVNNSRDADALAFIPGAFARAGTDRERDKFANAWGNALNDVGQPAKAAEKFRLAIHLNPNDWSARGNLVGVDLVNAGEEVAWRDAQAFFAQARAAPKSDQPRLRLFGNPAAVVWDLPLLLAGDLDDAAQNGGLGTSILLSGPQLADAYGLMHDPNKAARYLAASDPDNRITKAEAQLVPAYAALDRGDFAAALPLLEAFWDAWKKDPALRFSYQDSGCLTGLAYGFTGKLAQAEAVFKQAGSWSRCYAFHGDVLEHAGDLAGAARVWAEGLRVAPDLPFIYMQRGRSEGRRGDLKAAEWDLSTAAAKAPHFADPVKAYGDLLAREGRWKEALSQYDAALKSAPAWAELHRARDAAAAKA